jgi:hypothetical protein
MTSATTSSSAAKNFATSTCRWRWRTAGTGDLLLAGALEEPTEQAFLLFQGTSPDGARKFAESDRMCDTDSSGDGASSNGTPWLAMRPRRQRSPTAYDAVS